MSYGKNEKCSVPDLSKQGQHHSKDKPTAARDGIGAGKGKEKGKKEK